MSTVLSIFVFTSDVSVNTRVANEEALRRTPVENARGLYMLKYNCVGYLV